MKYIIIPDIHGNYTKLKNILTHSGLVKKGDQWKNTNSNHYIFLGDLIDGGLENKKVIDTVMNLVEQGTAQCIMGNHELNAVHWHYNLREKSESNLLQHQNFLKEYSELPEDKERVIQWMSNLPIYIETEKFICVHAYYNKSIIEKYELQSNQKLDFKTLLNISEEKNYGDIISLLKGVEISTPAGHSFSDIYGKVRTKFRYKWWSQKCETYSDIYLSVPDNNTFQNLPVPSDFSQQASTISKPVFVGHYKMKDIDLSGEGYAISLDIPHIDVYYQYNNEDYIKPSNIITI